MSFGFVLLCFLMWQNSDKPKKNLKQIVDKTSPNCNELFFVFVCSQYIGRAWRQGEEIFHHSSIIWRSLWGLNGYCVMKFEFAASFSRKPFLWTESFVLCFLIEIIQIIVYIQLKESHIQVWSVSYFPTEEKSVIACEGDRYDSFFLPPSEKLLFS